MKKVTVILIVLLSITSCKEWISYEWGEINKSLGELQKARNELRDVISDLEVEGYDCYELEEIDSRLEEVEDILDARFW